MLGMIGFERLAFLKRRKDLSKRVDIRIPSNIKYIRKVSSKIIEDLKQCSVDADTVFDIRLCVEEAVRNAIVHGNRCNVKEPVRVSYWKKDSEFFVEVEDRGKGYDHSKLPDPRGDKHILRNSGRGVYLILSLMNEVKFESNGSLIRMMKRLTERPKNTGE